MPETISAYLCWPPRDLEQYLDDLVTEQGHVPVTAGRAAELDRLIREVETELAWRVEL